jgi:hypothetical protein
MDWKLQLVSIPVSDVDDREPGSAKGLQLVVSDRCATCDERDVRTPADRAGS